MLEFVVGMETSGAVRDAIEALGYRAISVDNRPAQNGGRHHQGDVFKFLDANPGRFAGGVFHPDCTYLTSAAAWAFKDPNFSKYPGVGYHMKVQPGTLTGAERRAARLEGVATVERIRALPFPKGIENPRGFIPSFSTLGRENQAVHPHQFGSDASKTTCLWWFDGEGDRLDVKLPMDPAAFVQPRLYCPDCRKCSPPNVVSLFKGCPSCGGEEGRMLPRWANQTDTGQNNKSPGALRWQERSDTYPGIAAALARAIVDAALRPT